MTREREYLFTVNVRGRRVDTPGQAATWEWTQHQVKATSIVEVSRVLQRKLDDIHYVTKEVVR